MGMPGKPEGIAGTLRFAAELTEAGAMRDELADFRRKLSDAGRATYAARTGRHDDLVVALVIAAWWGCVRASFGRSDFGSELRAERRRRDSNSFVWSRSDGGRLPTYHPKAILPLAPL